MDFDREYFKGKTAVITGGAGGIGLALAEELLESNAAKVVIADINEERLAEAEASLREQYGDRAKGIICNVTKEDEIQSLIAKSTEYFDGSFDLLFNNAGAGFKGWFVELDNEDWDIAFALNFFSALYGIRAVLPLMLEQGNGQIVNIISGVAILPVAWQSRYAATKSALNGLTLSLRAEHWDDNIKFNSATPGTTATNIFEADEAPEGAQTPHQAASAILNGVAHNTRIIYGDTGDESAGTWAFHPDAQDTYDEYQIPVTRARRSGKIAY